MNMIHSVFRTGKNYYPQVFLQECKYVVKEKKIHNYIIDDVKHILMKKTLMRKFLKNFR